MVNTSVKATVNLLKLPPNSQLPTPTNIPMNRKVEKTASPADIHLNEAATGVMALDRSVQVPTLAPKPRRSVPRKTPRDSRKTTRPVQNESQSSLILALGCVIGLYLPVNPVPDKPFSQVQARSGAYWELPIREQIAGTTIWSAPAERSGDGALALGA